MLGLVDALRDLDSHFGMDGDFYLPHGWYGPSYIAAMAAILNNKNLSYRQFDCHPSVASYLKAIGFQKALWGVDEYQQHRTNVGINYSLLTTLASTEATDTATTSVNNCLRSFVHNRRSQGMSDLAQVVGELHDNVWSHGRSTGFSIAQKWGVPYTNGQDHYLEFSLADKGLGFYREMTRAGISVSSHREAIQWCIQEGNSTKHGDLIDGFAQAIPNDIIGSPFGEMVAVRDDENHHQGLGLYHLTNLVRNYHGTLNLVSGDCCFKIDETGHESYLNPPDEWQGVAISCRFKESDLLRELRNEALEDSGIDFELQRIMEQLGGN